MSRVTIREYLDHKTIIDETKQFPIKPTAPGNIVHDTRLQFNTSTTLIVILYVIVSTRIQIS